MGLFGFGKKKAAAGPAEALAIWVHRRQHFEILSALAQQRGLEPFAIQGIGGAFGAVLALMSDDGPVRVSKKHLDALGLSYREATQRALENLRTMFASGSRSDGLLAWEGPNAEAALLAIPALAPRLPIQGYPVAMAPAAGLMLLAGSEEPEALARMLTRAERAYAESEEFRSLRALSWRRGEPHDWLPPKGHALHGRFAAASAKTRRHEAEALAGALAPDDAPLARLAVLPPEQGGLLVAGLIRDANVLVPPVDAVTLIDTDDAPHARVEVDANTLLDLMPHLFDPVPLAGEAGMLFRVRGDQFPSPRERAFLVERMAFDRAHPKSEEREGTAEELLARWDAGAPLLARPAPGVVELTAPDHLRARVSAEQFGERVQSLPVRDQMMLTLMGGDPAQLAEAKRPLRSRIEAERPPLLSSIFVSTLQESGQPETHAAQSTVSLEPARLFPTVRPPDYAQGAEANERGMVAGAAPGEVLEVKPLARLTRDLREGLSLELVSDLGERVAPVNRDLLPELWVDAAWRSAMLNLDAASLEPLARIQPGLYEGPWHDDYDASRVLLLPRLIQACEVNGEPLLFVPTVGRVWVTGSEDRGGIGSALERIEIFLEWGQASSPYAFRQLLFGWPWVLRGGELIRYPLPEGHPLAARIATLDARLKKQREDSRRHIGSLAQAVARVEREGSGG